MHLDIYVQYLNKTEKGSLLFLLKYCSKLSPADPTRCCQVYKTFPYFLYDVSVLPAWTLGRVAQGRNLVALSSLILKSFKGSLCPKYLV